MRTLFRIIMNALHHKTKEKGTLPEPLWEKADIFAEARLILVDVFNRIVFVVVTEYAHVISLPFVHILASPFDCIAFGFGISFFFQSKRITFQGLRVFQRPSGPVPLQVRLEQLVTFR